MAAWQRGDEMQRQAVVRRGDGGRRWRWRWRRPGRSHKLLQNLERVATVAASPHTETCGAEFRIFFWKVWDTVAQMVLPRQCGWTLETGKTPLATQVSDHFSLFLCLVCFFFLSYSVRGKKCGHCLPQNIVEDRRPDHDQVLHDCR